MPSDALAMRYYDHLRRRDLAFFCPLTKASAVCGLPVHSRTFEGHCSREHGLDPKRTCVWCGEYSWPVQTKKRHTDHLIECSGRFLTRVQSPEEPGPSGASPDPGPSEEALGNLRLLSLRHRDEAMRDYGRELASSDWALLEDDVRGFLMRPDPLALTFADDDLNLAASCVRAYLDTRSTHDWFHAMVRGVALASFLSCLVGESARLLPFSCWCDGGKHEPLHRQHRHFVLAAEPKGRFRERVWPRVTVESRPGSSFAVKRLKTVSGPMHLVNLLGYVSHRESSCAFQFQRGEEGERTSASGRNHFRISRTLPEHFRLPLVLQWDGGVLDLLREEKLQNVSAPRLVRVVERREGRWCTKLGNVRKLERGLVLPVDRCFLPTEKRTPCFLHLASGRKLYFERTTESLDDATWLRRQAEGGNRFYEAVGEEVWYPRKRDQESLNRMMPLWQETRKLRGDLAEVKRELGEVKREMGEVKRELEGARGRIASLEEELGEVKRENASLKRKLEGGVSQPATRKHGPA